MMSMLGRMHIDSGFNLRRDGDLELFSGLIYYETRHAKMSVLKMVAAHYGHSEAIHSRKEAARVLAEIYTDRWKRNLKSAPLG